MDEKTSDIREHDMGRETRAALKAEFTPAPKQTSSARMIGVMASIGLLSGVLIVCTYQLTISIIKANKAKALEQAIFQVVPGATSKRVFIFNSNEFIPLEKENDKAFKYYAAYNDDSKLLGVALEARGQGFMDTVTLLYGYSPERDCIIGMKVLEMKETPGLGDNIEKNARFKSNFDALEVKYDPVNGRIQNPVALVKFGKKTEPWQIEAITGATISSTAVGRILHESTTYHVPIIERNLAQLQNGGKQ